MMNPEKGSLEPLMEKILDESPYANKELAKRMVDGFEQAIRRTLWDVFTVGEVLIVKNSYFRVHEITNKRLILRPVRVVDGDPE